MSTMTKVSKRPVDSMNMMSAVTAEDVLQGLHRLPHAAWDEVLQFIEFLEYKQNTISEDEALWQAVQTERTHRQAHPEDVILCQSADELAAALGNDE